MGADTVSAGTSQCDIRGNGAGDRHNGGEGRQQSLDGFRYVLRMPDGHLAELTGRPPTSASGNPVPESLAVPLAADSTLEVPVHLASDDFAAG